MLGARGHESPILSDGQRVGLPARFLRTGWLPPGRLVLPWIPSACGPVPVGDDDRAVGAELCGLERCASLDAANLPPGDRVPHARSAVEAGGDDTRAVSTVGETGYCAGVAHEFGRAGVALDVPDPELAVAADARHPVAPRRDRDVLYAAPVSCHHCAGAAGGALPGAKRSLVARREETPPVASVPQRRDDARVTHERAHEPAGRQLPRVDHPALAAGGDVSRAADRQTLYFPR